MVTVRTLGIKGQVFNKLQSNSTCGFSGCSPSERLISRVGGQARSKTPNADMERSVYGADCTSTPTYLNKVTPCCLTCPLTVIWISFQTSVRHVAFLPLQPPMLRDLRFGAEPDDGENLRQMGRSLSGTVVTSRRSRLTATRSFVSPISSALPPPCGSAVELHLPDNTVAALYTLLSPVLLFPRCLSCFFLLSCFSISNLSSCSLRLLCLFPLSLSKVKQTDVSASPCLLPLF